MLRLQINQDIILPQLLPIRIKYDWGKLTRNFIRLSTWQKARHSLLPKHLLQSVTHGIVWRKNR
ncbi:hypothetical protein GALL_129960 [mine drainage metagenome]|uniref:Uncharacterized protein n=1 Tax=mine drainage metagenome TaxID=410659 RepID=A0A1J5S9Q5_9ZZZZ